MRHVRPRSALAVLGALALTAGTVALAAAPASAASSPTTLVVNADQPFRSVTHVASGSLYGLDTATIPADNLVEPLHPNTFVQMAPGGHQLPNGEPAPGGDSLVVAPEAAKAGAKVVVRMPDWYPNFPYKWVSWSDWLSAVDTQVKSVLSSSARNISAFELWNEPDGTWDTAAAGPFDAGWARTYQEVRKLDPTARIQGPSFTTQVTGMKQFLTDAVASNTVPDIISWHELDNSNRIAADVATVVADEKALGITPRPIAIEEYGAPAEVGIPGSLVGYLAQFERVGVDNAELAFWNHYGTLGDLLTDTGGKPNGAYWLYDWYGQMSGNMVTVTPPGAAGTGLDGAASVNSARNQVSVIFGGGSGSTAVKVTGLDKLTLGNRVNVKLEYTPSKGRTTAVSGPITISDTTYTVRNGAITVPVSMNSTYGYHLVITPQSTQTTTSLAGTYTLTNLHSGLQLATSGSSVDQATAGESWRIINAGSGLYRIIDQKTGLLLGVNGTTSGTDALISGGPATPDQLWQLIPDDTGHYELANADSGLVLAIDQDATSAGAPVVQWADGLSTTSVAAGPRVPGKVGNAIALSGNGDYVALPSGIVSSLTGDYTISAWVNPAENRTWSRLFDFGTGTSNYLFLTVSNGTDLRFAITSGSGEQQLTGTGVLPLNTWSLVTVTLSGATGTLYVNGTAVATNTAMTLHPANLGTTTQNWIGRSEFSSDPYLNAKVDDFAIYNRALSASEIAALASGTAAAGNVADYRFDEAGGATVLDSSGNGRNATVESTPQLLPFGDSATADHWWTLTPVQH